MKTPRLSSPHFVRAHRFWTGWFEEPVYSATVQVCWDVDTKGMESYIARTFPEYVGAIPRLDPWCAWSLELSDKQHELYLICLRKFQWTPDDIGTLAHECLHTTASMLRSRGLSFNKQTEEAYAYLHDSLVRRCLAEMQKARR
jgi:hypothetical protein